MTRYGYSNDYGLASVADSVPPATGTGLCGCAQYDALGLASAADSVPLTGAGLCSCAQYNALGLASVLVSLAALAAFLLVQPAVVAALDDDRSTGRQARGQFTPPSEIQVSLHLPAG